MRKILFLSMAVGLMTIAIACGDNPANDSLSGTSGGGGATEPGSSGTSGATAPESSSGSSGTTATSGGLTPVDASTPPSAPPPPAGACLPPNVAAVFAAKCTACHADPPINGSLSGLVKLADLLATSKEDATKNEAQLSLARMQSTTAPMPPASVGTPASAADIATLQTWINAKYTSSACTDGGAPPPPPPTDVFTGTTFKSQTAGNTHNAGRNCMGGCHNHGFTFAGTLTNGAGAGVAGAEVRLVDANNKAISVYTGSNGNFHSSTSWMAPAKIGVRDATAKNLMVTSLNATNGGCNGCHVNGGVQVPIHLP